MPKYEVVIKDPRLAQAREVERSVEANLALVAPAERPRVERVVRQHVERMVGTKRRGAVHTVASTECPEGMPNCRDCGDPQFAESCKAAGHCPHCGTRHGIAPQRIVAENGYELREVRD